LLFNSGAFLVFFVVVYAVYWALRRQWRAQNVLLLVASLFFYGWWDVRFLFLFILTTTVDFYCALMIHQGRVPLRQRLIESVVLVASASFCVTVNWSAVTVVRHGFRLGLHVDWTHVLPTWGIPWAVFVATLAGVLLVNVADSWLIAREASARRKLFLIASVVSNLSVLGFFKYYNFFADSFAGALHALFGITASEWTLRIILPVGISFYTFQSLAYTIDVYRRKFEPLQSYLTLATGLSFFPLLVAGPIERPNHLLPQFLRPRSAAGEQWREGMWLIFWGLFKKMVVADNMAGIVRVVFAAYDGHNPSHEIPTDGLRLLLGVYAFAFQIYGDFSGYSDIARGTGRLLGFDVMRNFNLPYFAISPSDFWQRWHISLSSWLRDYLYIPLGGNRYGTWATYRNLFLTMLLGGLWHGAAWTFVLWGAYHGLLLIGYRLFAPALAEAKKASPIPVTAAVMTQPEVVREPVTTQYTLLLPLAVPRAGWPSGKAIRTGLLWLLMFHLTLVGWLLFRAQNVTTVSVFLTSIFTQFHGSAATTELFQKFLFYAWFLVLFECLCVVMKTLDPMKRFHWFVRLNIWIFILMSIMALAPEDKVSFIYFAF
jgi:D-alanyl-lipoteichoic acid acyltransferase DltB (MBOAT superfamily)